ncbi:hypothetical protein [Legionella sainthelensi]|uniref:hypothetical protein n=1 Tax=Legionella sainthelensi TaxID=28087 RepID=UPI000E207B89|nr:hypothetical protein [Legionella sainthelensi]
MKFLNDNAHKYFIDALKFYYIQSAENVRRVVEEFLRHVFNNTKVENIKILDRKLKAIGKQNEIKTSCHKFFNTNTNHNDGDVNDTECEFIILQSGLLLKYINRIQPD